MAYHAHDRAERVGDPSETESHGDDRSTGELCYSFLDDIAADDEQHGEDVGRIAPLIGEDFGRWSITA